VARQTTAEVFFSCKKTIIIEMPRDLSAGAPDPMRSNRMRWDRME